MNISLTPELERQVEERVSTGLYTSASEVVREALRLFLQFDSARSRSIEELGGLIAAGVAQADAGQVISGDEGRRRSRERIARRSANKEVGL